jgi:ATP/maltotriose-dependent transcriptional regulator MalT/DNA-binding SARP family transcriptional activator
MELVQPLIITKTLLPRKQANLLRRPRLIEFLHEHIDRKLIIISASAGYGKTSLLIDFAYDTDLPVCWLSVTESDRDLRSFVEYLVASIRQRFPGFGEQTQNFFQQQPTLKDPDALVAILVNELYTQIPDYFVLIIDDYQLIDDSTAVNLFLDSLLQHLPDNTHLIITSRAIPTLTPRGLALLTARQQIAGLGVKDLRFTAQEVQALLEQNYNQHVPVEVAEKLAVESEGWITGILLTTHTLWKGLFRAMIGPGGAGSQVYEYLANEVFDLQPRSIQEFMLGSCILDEMTAFLCDELFGITNSREVLKFLEDRNLFISRFDRGDERWYQYHQLFREFLRTKIGETPERRSELHRRAGHIFEAHADLEKAIRHYLAAGAHGEAAWVANRAAESTFASGRLVTLAEWLNPLPGGVLTANPKLLWYRGRVHQRRGEFDRALEAFEQARKVYESQADQVGVAQVMAESGVVYRLQGRIREAVESCERALSILPASSEHLAVIAEAHRNIGICRAQMGAFAQGIEELRQSLDLYTRTGDRASMAVLHNDLGTALRLEGNLAGAEVHYQDALQLWRDLGNTGQEAGILNNIGVVHHFRGEYANALAAYAEALPKAQEAGARRTTAYIRSGIGDVYRDIGRYDAALEAYEQALQISREIGEGGLTAYLLDAEGNAYRLKGDYPQALNLVRQAFDRAAERQSDYEMGLFEMSLGVIACEQNRVQQALDHLNHAHQLLARTGARQELGQVHLHLAQAYYLSGDNQQALSQVRHMLDWTFRLGYDHFLVPLARRTLPLLRYAVSRDPSNSHLKRLLNNAEQDVDLARPMDRPAEVATPLPSLRIFGFGEPRIFRGSELITPSEWASVRTKEVFFYLLCHPYRRREQIGAAFWPDLSPGKVRSNFHVTIYRIRRALNQPDYIVYDQDQYSFNRQLPYWFDVEEFERLLNQAERFTGPAGQRARLLSDAAALYQGDFLEGLYPPGDDEWIILWREMLRRRYLEALLSLADHYLSEQQYVEAMETYQKVLLQDNLSEPAQRGLMLCYVRLGERGLALRQFQILSQRMEEEYGARPESETVALYQQILRGA